MGKETGGGGRRRGEKKEGDGKVGGGGGGGGGGLRSNGEEVEEGEVDEMHQMPRSSLAAASIPSAKGSFFLSPQNNHHHHNDHHQPLVNELNQRASSPFTNSRASSRTSASFKQRTVGQKMPGGGTARPPIQFAVSSAAQLARPVAVPARSSNHVMPAEGQDAGSHFQGGRPTASLPSASSIVHAGSRPQVSVANHTVHVKGLAQHSQPRTTVHRPMSRSASPSLLQQSSEEIGQQEQSVQMGPAPSSAISHPRNFSGISHPKVSQAPSPQRTQTQALHQQQAASSTVATQQQVTAEVRPPVSGSDLASNDDVLLVDRSVDNSILVKVCDRNVRLSSEQDPTSLYALCRRWIRNDVPRTDQAKSWEQPSLPRPLTAVEAEKTEPETMENGSKKVDSALLVEPELTKPVDSITEKELLQHHVEHFKNIRKRCREDRMRRVARFKQRLALLLPANAENGRRDSLSDAPHHP